MSNCKCGSEPIPGADPSIIIRLGDLTRGLPRTKPLAGLSQSPIFLSLTSDFCSVPAASNFNPPSGISSFLFNRKISSLWAEKCRCKRDRSFYESTFFIKWFVPDNPVPVRDYEISAGHEGALVGLRTEKKIIGLDEVIEIYGYSGENNYSAEYLVQRASHRANRGNTLDFKSHSQRITLQRCFSSPPPEPPPLPGISFPSIPGSPFPYTPLPVLEPSPPPEPIPPISFPFPPKNPALECCDCC